MHRERVCCVSKTIKCHGHGSLLSRHNGMCMARARIVLGQIRVDDPEQRTWMQRGEAFHANQPVLALHHIDKRLAVPLVTAPEQTFWALDIVSLNRAIQTAYSASRTSLWTRQEAQGQQSGQGGFPLLPLLF